MSIVVQFPQSFASRVRLLAAELHGRQGTIQLREARRAAGQLAEQARCNGAARWEAIRLEDEFFAAVLNRINQLGPAPRGRRSKGASHG